MKFQVEVAGEDVVLKKLPDGKPPLRAVGFLRFDPQDHVELFLELRDGKILIWSQEKNVFAQKSRA